MRVQQHIQERHLAECVRRSVITEDQMQSILGVARSMAPGDGAAPDFSWVALVQGLAAAAAVAGAGIWCANKLDGEAPELMLAAFALASGAALGVGLLLKQRASTRVPAAVLLAGSAALSWGVGCALYMIVRHVPLHPDYAMVNWDVVERGRDEAQLAGDLTVMLAALLVGLRARVAAAAAPGAVAFVVAVMTMAERFFSGSGYSMPERESQPWLLGASVALMGAAFAVDRIKPRSRTDASFWMHTAGLLVLGLVVTMRIDRAPIEALGWLAVALALAWIGLRFDRRIYLVASAASVLFHPAFALDHAPGNNDTLVLAALGVGLTVVAISAAWLRHYYTTKWIADPARQVDRTVWC